MIIMRVFLVFVCAIVFTCSADLQFITSVNPGCGKLCTKYNQLVYGRLPRPDANDSLHIFLTAGRDLGDFAVSYVQSSDPKQMVSFNWTMLLSNDTAERAAALVYSNPNAAVLSKFSLVMANLIEYNDASDSVDPRQATNLTLYSFGNFAWRIDDLQNTTDNGGARIVISANSFAPDTTVLSPVEDESLVPIETEPLPQSSPFTLFGANDSAIQLTIQLSSGSGLRSSSLPKLEFTGSNNQIELLLRHLWPSQPNPRFAIEAALVDMSAGSAFKQSVDANMNIDDEYTPGIFKITNWQTANSARSSCYAQWKPVAYWREPRSISGSTEARVLGMQNNKFSPLGISTRLAGSLNASFAYALNGDADWNFLTVGRFGAVNVTFGISTDKFYTAINNYTAWTFSVGLGEAPADQVSSLVIIVILCGLGLPALLMSVALVYVCVRKIRGQSAADGAVSAYQPINA